MTNNGDGSWSYTVTGLTSGSRHEFKVTDGTWTNNWPGANSWLFADASGNATIKFMPNTAGDGWGPDTNRIGVNNDAGTWTAVGDWQGWNNANPATVMTAQGGGIYKFETVIPSVGSYQYKAVNSGSWDAVGTDSRTIKRRQLVLHHDRREPDRVDMWLNNNNGSIKVDVLPVPEPATIGMLGLGLLALARRR